MSDDILRREPPTKWLIRYYPVSPHQHLKVYNLEPLDIPDYEFADVQDTIRARLDEYELALKTSHCKKEGSSIVGFNNCWIAVIEAYNALDATNKFFDQLLSWKRDKEEAEDD